MKIHELINEDLTDQDLDALDKKIALRKAQDEKNQARTSSGSTLKKHFWKGKQAGDNLKYSKPVQAISHVYNKLAR